MKQNMRFIIFDEIMHKRNNYDLQSEKAIENTLNVMVLPYYREDDQDPLRKRLQEQKILRDMISRSIFR